jgi:hypothetical protein
MSRSVVLAFTIIMLLVGCASVRPEPVTSKNQNDPGIRYFETRPFIIVNKPFPLEAVSVLVDARVSDDGRSIAITGEVDKPFVHFTEGGSISSSNMLILGSSTSRPNPAAQGGEQPESDDEKGQANTEEDGNSVGTKAGYSSLTLTTDNAGMPIFALNEHLSMIYLPDFEREFLIRRKTRLGITSVKIVRGPGGTLLGLNAEVDNGAITKPLMDAYGKIVSAGSDALLASLSPTGAAVAIAQGAAVATEAPVELRGKLVTFRMHLIKFAAVGVYPIVKPGEVKMGVYTAVAGTSVLEPVVGYQIPYRYFELVIAEPLFTENPLQAFAVMGTGQDNGNQQNCGAELSVKLATVTELKRMSGVAVEGLDISNVRAEKVDKGCVGKVTFAATKDEGNGRVNLGSGEKTSVKQQINLHFSGTTVVIEDP